MPTEAAPDYIFCNPSDDRPLRTLFDPRNHSAIIARRLRVSSLIPSLGDDEIDANR
jgi:hypothetical protein